MEFEEMQVIWNSQNNEKLFVIDEAALHDSIRRKGRSVSRLLELVEWLMILVNFAVGVILIVDALQGNNRNNPGFQFVIAAMYIGYALFAVVRRLRRRRQEIHFEATMVGDLDKAIWQSNYLLRQGHTLMWWYLLPLVLVASLGLFLSSESFWEPLLMLLLLPASYLGMRWEARKWHLPKKQSLESLREKLLASEGD